MPDSDPYHIHAAVPEELAGALKAYAALKNIFLLDIFVQAIEDFLAHCQLLHSRGQYVPYLFAPKDARPFNMRIPQKLARRLQTLSEVDRVPVRRAAYTALVHFAVNQKLIPSIGAVQSGVPVEHEDPSLVDFVRAVRNKNRPKPR